MSKTESLAKQQAKIKPKPEDIIASNLSEEAQQNALAFLEYCKAKKISCPWSSTNRWNMKSKGKSIGYIDIGGERKGNSNGSWYIDIDLRELRQYEEAIEKAGVSELVKKYLKPCTQCASCSPIKKLTFLGKDFENLCCGMIAYVGKPDADVLENVQKLINIRLAIPQGTANLPIYDSKTEGLTRIDNTLRISGEFDTNESYLFDGKYAKYYYIGPYGEFKTDKSSHDIVFELDEPTEIAMYGLVTSMRPDAPQSWTLYGAESKEGPWVELDAQAEFPKPVTSYTEKAFKLGAPVAYRYYRIVFEGRWFVVAQVHLYTRCK